MMLFVLLGLGFLSLILFALWMSKSMKDSFQSLSFELMQKNNQHFMQLAQSEFEKHQTKAEMEWEKKEKSFETLLKPLSESMNKVEEQNRMMEKRREGAYSSLEKHLELLMESEKLLRTETSQLAQALKSPNIRGAWGQLHLRRVVELSGMLNHCDFFEQQEIRKDGRISRPDLVVRLPGNRQIVVDAKTPIQSYMEAQEANDEIQRQRKLKEHAEHLRIHIKDLSSREYWKQFEHSPEYVILFLPAEAFYSSALQIDPGLIEVGAKNKIIIANPTTLIAILKTAHLVWNEEKVSVNAKEISEIGRELYDRMMKMGDHFTSLGKHINQSVDSYNQTISSFETRVLVSARKLKEKGAATFGKDLIRLDELEKKTKTLKVLESHAEK